MNGISFDELGSVGCQLLTISMFLMAPDEDMLAVEFLKRKKRQPLEAPVLSQFQASAYVGMRGTPASFWT